MNIKLLMDLLCISLKAKELELLLQLLPLINHQLELVQELDLMLVLDHKDWEESLLDLEVCHQALEDSEEVCHQVLEEWEEECHLVSEEWGEWEEECQILK